MPCHRGWPTRGRFQEGVVCARGRPICPAALASALRWVPSGLAPGLSHLGFVELGEETCEERVTQGGAKELAFEGLFGAFELRKVEGQASQQGNVLWSVILAVAGLILVHGHVENPVKAVLHTPMSAAHIAEAAGGQFGAEQVVGGFGADLGACFTGADDLADGGKTRPGMLLL